MLRYACCVMCDVLRAACCVVLIGVVILYYNHNIFYNARERSNIPTHAEHAVLSLIGDVMKLLMMMRCVALRCVACARLLTSCVLPR